MLTHFERGFTPSEPLEAFLEHNQLVGSLRAAARSAEAQPVRHAQQR
jgi:hypothetical protein